MNVKTLKYRIGHWFIGGSRVGDLISNIVELWDSWLAPVVMLLAAVAVPVSGYFFFPAPGSERLPFFCYWGVLSLLALVVFTMGITGLFVNSVLAILRNELVQKIGKERLGRVIYGQGYELKCNPRTYPTRSFREHAGMRLEVDRVLIELAQTFDRACEAEKPGQPEPSNEVVWARRKFWDTHNLFWSLGFRVQPKLKYYLAIGKGV